MEFKAEVVDGELVVKAISETKPNAQGGTDCIVHVPSFPEMERQKRILIEKQFKEKHGIRSI